MKIGLVGFEFSSSNKGCEALSYSLMPMLAQIAELRPLEIINISIHDSMGLLPQMYPDISFTNIHVQLKKPSGFKKLSELIGQCDCVLDITHGDSFSDIYGAKWFVHTTLVKQLVLWNRVPLILMPQTYGPFNRTWAKKWAETVIASARVAFCRDSLSAGYMAENFRKISDNKVKVYTDIAFALPYTQAAPAEQGCRMIGLNISGLLWDDAEHSSPLGLKTDYREYCYALIHRLTGSGSRVYLIPHVLCNEREGYDYFENDCRAIDKLAAEHPECRKAGDFHTSVDAKSFISGMDVLVAARMHASIAAFSSGVASIPFAYSRKFKGLYDDLGYEYIIDGRELSTDEAVEKTLRYIAKSDELKRKSAAGMEIVNTKIIDFKRELAEQLSKAGNEGKRR